MANDKNKKIKNGNFRKANTYMDMHLVIYSEELLLITECSALFSRKKKKIRRKKNVTNIGNIIFE